MSSEVCDGPFGMSDEPCFPLIKMGPSKTKHVQKPNFIRNVLHNKDPFLILLGQWLNFKLLGVTYLVGKIKFKLFFSGSIG